MTKPYLPQQRESSINFDESATPPPTSTRLHPRTLSIYGTLFGAGMIALALLWAGLIRARSLSAWFPADHWLRDLLLGAGVGVLFALIAYRLIALIPAMLRIELIITQTLDMRALTVPYSLWFGLIAGIPEEILFRGALQPDIGLVVAAIIFGALHAITPMYFIYATTAGLLLGGLAAWSGGLWMPVAAHVLIDVVMFLLLLARWRHYTLPDSEEKSELLDSSA
ncbi:MAG: CPBP family intramembrane metalloprotease [Anaerolineae bacterium]|nr:CPBP family intramembrane metalloprotease [Anaerolineae bacterium]